MDVVARDVPVYTYKDGNGRDNWTVARGALGNGGARWLPVRKPELYAGEVFQTFARAHGISLKSPKPLETLPENTEIARVESVPLRQITVDMLRYSTNLTAETIGMAATTARVGRPDSIRASADAMNRWLAQESGATGFALVDHSGLGDTSRISAQTMAQVLRLFQQRVGIKHLMKPFPLRDEDGRQIKDHPVSVLSKTGTLNFVSGLAGFADYPDGTEVVFAIFCADIHRRAGLSRAERERPEGAASWNRRAKQLQQALIERWGVMYTS
jgi:D-alanyl-D-alanine carboxypeptidase/D-alanyl-D-alanine-endopeptidase (penicillin-binding protein 4)